MWSMAIPTHASWTIQKIFGLRKLVQPWIQHVIGDGEDSFLWLDNWHPFGPLKAKFEGKLNENFVRNLQSKVASIIRNGSWSWIRSRNVVVLEIMDGYP